MTEALELLGNHGPWAVVVLMGAAFVKYYNDVRKLLDAKDVLIAKKDETIMELNKNHHQEMVSVVRECTGVLTTVNDSLERCERRNERRDDNG